MNDSKFYISIENSIKLLKEIGLFKGKGVKNIGFHSSEFKKVAKKNSHTKMFNVATANNDYEILLKDDSIFQFSFEKDKLRYCFIQNPNIVFSKEEYLNLICPTEELLLLSTEEYEELLNSIEEEEYEQFLTECDLNLESNIIRYDMDSEGYMPLIHAYSHIHIGLNECLRIPCSKILTPLKFVIFSIKNTYSDNWKKAILDNSNFDFKVKSSKDDCNDVPPEKWILQEKYEMFLG